MRPAIQLHTVRDFDESLQSIIRRAGEYGFEGVEFAGRIQQSDPGAVADALAETGITPVGAHVPLQELERDTEALLDVYDTVGCHRLTIPHLPATHFRTQERVKTLADRVERLSRKLEKRGFELSYHNTRHDLVPPLPAWALATLVDDGLVPGVVEGVVLERLRQRQRSVPVANTGLGLLAAYTEPSHLGFEIDAGEVCAAGYRNALVFDELGDRVHAVHLCDVTDAADGYRSTEPGTGVLDFELVFDAAYRSGIEWAVYEHDHPDDPELTVHRGSAAVVDGVREYLATVSNQRRTVEQSLSEAG